MNFKSLLGRTRNDQGLDAPEKKGFSFSEFSESINSLDSQNMGGWPRSAKIFVAGLVFLAIVLLTYALVIRPIQTSIGDEQSKEQTLLNDYRDKSSKLRNLQSYEVQLKKMEADFNLLLSQLPQKTEIPGLVEDISFAGAGSSVRINDIKVEPEKPSTELIELPISINAQGDYHSFGSFVSALSSMPRIVTAHDFEITPIVKEKSKSEVPILMFALKAKTYRLNDQKPEDAKVKDTTTVKAGTS